MLQFAADGDGRSSTSPFFEKLYLKIDTEGYEFEILKGARDLLCRGIFKAIIDIVGD